ncbi:MAG: SCO family protein [Paracoccus sp. (in: a-proteobacteria)]|uniref:SCO family protein n=1 Tax=Paracoccus sp. TaxID=267 RepID=UPI003242929A
MRLNRLQKILWVAVAVALVALGAAVVLIDRSPSPVAQAEFRPTFTLPDAEGRLRSPADFPGKHLLVFFGFTNCPDICPTTLAEVAQVMDDLGDQAGEVQPLFISIDPERDREMGLAEYTEAFHPSILGLAGDAAQTRAAADSFRIYYEREANLGALDGYAMSHSPGLYLISPEGDWLGQFTYGTPASEIVADLQARL